MACPTHIVQGWNGSYFDKVLLCDLRMQYQVGHLAGEICPHPHPAFSNHFTIIDMNGIHDVTLDFCSCMQKRPFAMQLQGSWLFPAMDTEPCTAITTAALEQFQMLTFMGKILAYEYYHSLVHLTNNTGVMAPSDNFDAFIRVVREWSFIRLLKRAGMGNDHGRWKAAKPGSCTMECLACPCPGINIPDYVDPEGPNAWEHMLYIDQHFGDFNWQKNVSQGDTLLHKIKDAMPKASDHEYQFERFMALLPRDNIVKWTKMVEDWEVDRTKPNPFARTVASKTEATMHLQLSQEDAQDEMAGLDGDALHAMSLKAMISQGIQLESSQQRISHLNKELGAHSTDLQRAQVLEKSNRLCHSIELWFVVQEDNGLSFPAYSLPLYLPSSILLAHPCDKTIPTAVLV
ncbi:hypothetical protein EDD18DRAFT_1364550 [Armillaria luteobubalina]|uniref:CxC2-like cysteine cluster KDZ transposase-associated domain-containing protein n=1 Tax=Armillaria luteobubalina TaxID=153913 RepID=A0AA39UDY0_9AGAR|nr:hypothetical protein EDD18DRAFT_1364550 [Armillaria luteobubalina]